MNGQSITLNRAEVGKKLTITNLAEHPIVKRMNEMGVFPGIEITVLHKSPFQKAITIDLLGYRMALRLNEAKLITVVAG